MSFSVIRTDRVDLHVVRAEDYALLAQDPADPRLWIDRGFGNPHRHFVDNAGPLPYRIPQVREYPWKAPFLLRVAVLRTEKFIIGSAGFHSMPDEDGMIEIGFEVCAPLRRQGLGTEILHGMWGWVITKPGVRTLRYCASIDNVASQRIVRGLGFTHMGVQEDEIDGPEDIFEMSVEEYRRRALLE